MSSPSPASSIIHHHNFLRPLEHILFTLPCRISTNTGGQAKAELILVSNRSSGLDQGGIIVINPPSPSGDVKIYQTIAVTSQFTQNVLQCPPSPSTSFFHQSAKPHMDLKLRDGQGPVLTLQIKAQHTAKVHLLLAELRRLTELSKVAALPRTLSHSWLDFYPVDATASSQGHESASLSPEASTSTLAILSTPTSESQSTPTFDLAKPLEGVQISPEGSTSTIDADEQHPNPYLPSFSRTEFVRKRLFAREDQWSSKSTLRIRISTYNVNDKLPPPSTTDLSPLVSGSPDLIVLGLQEVDLRSSALLVSQGSDRSEAWTAALMNALGDDNVNWERVAVSQYVGVVMIVLVRKELVDAVSEVSKSERGIGLMGFGGNKAGVAVRLKIHESTFCFVNAHLAAFATALDRRRLDYQNLQRGLFFPLSTPGDSYNPAFERFLPVGRGFSPGDCDVLVWMGDLNYRIDLEDDIVCSMAAEKQWSAMLEKDQLKADIASGKSFGGFSEGKIDFPPTFKYLHGTTDFDSKRAPAYTDRILFTNPASVILPTPITKTKSKTISEALDKPLTPSSDPSTPAASPGDSTAISTLISTEALKIECKEYTSCPTILYSDHIPVSALITTKVIVADEDKRAKIMAGIETELDRLEEVYKPNLEVLEQSLDFGEVRYRRPVVREVKMRNNGRVAASFRFRSPSLNQPICKPLFWVIPSEGVVQSGREAVLRVVAGFDERLAGRLTLGEMDMKDVLVLQIAGGKDIFITLQATPLPTIVSLPLHILAHSPSPSIRSSTLADRRRLATPSTPDPYAEVSRGVKTAKEVWRLLEGLMEIGNCAGVSLSDTHSGDLDDILEIIEALDTATPLPTPLDPRKLFISLIHMLTALPTPLLPYHLQARCILSSDRDEAFGLLEEVGQVERNVLVGIVSIIRLCFGHLIDGLEGEGYDQKNILIDSLSPGFFGTSFRSLMVDLSGISVEQDGRKRYIGLLFEG